MDTLTIILVKNDFRKKYQWEMLLHDLTLPKETKSVELKLVEAKQAYGEGKKR